MIKIERQISLKKLSSISDFVNLASRYTCDVKLQGNRHTVDGKSILAILTLALNKVLTVTAYGQDASEFAASLDRHQFI